MPVTERIARSVTGLAVAILIACAAPVAVFAHAEVIDIDPADGSQLLQSPSAITITFNEPVGADIDAIRVLDATGHQVDSAPESRSDNALAQPLPVLADGWYLVDYRIISADGHVLHQASTFGVGAADSASRAAVLALQSAADPAVWVTRSAADLSLLIAVGVALGWALMHLRGERLRRLRRMALAVAAALGVVALLVAVIDGGAPWIGSPASLGAVFRVLLLAAASLTATASARALPALFGAAALATMSLGGHPGETPLGALLLLLHLGAAAIWLGAAPALLLLHADPAVSDDDALAATRAFSRWATRAIGAVAVGGLLLGALLTDGFGGGINGYVLLLVGKSVAVAVAIVGGAWARRRLRSTTTAAGLRVSLRRLFAVDSGLLVLVAALSAALTLGSPHTGHSSHAAAGGGCRFAAPLEGVVLQIGSGGIGTNAVNLFGVPQAEAVRIELVRPGSPAALVAPLAVAVGGSGALYQGTVVLPAEGPWETTVVVSIDRFSEVKATCTLRIAP